MLQTNQSTKPGSSQVLSEVIVFLVRFGAVSPEWTQLQHISRDYSVHSVLSFYGCADNNLSFPRQM